MTVTVPCRYIQGHMWLMYICRDLSIAIKRHCHIKHWIMLKCPEYYQYANLRISDLLVAQNGIPYIYIYIIPNPVINCTAWQVYGWNTISCKIKAIPFNETFIDKSWFIYTNKKYSFITRLTLYFLLLMGQARLQAKISQQYLLSCK